MNTVSHLAGSAITLTDREGNNPRVIQRCAICGEKLADSLNTAMPLRPDGTPPVFPTWPAGQWVQVSGSQPRRYLLIGDSERLPADNCVPLVE